MIELNAVLEAAVLRESEQTLRELVTAFHNVGLSQPQIALMLRAIADELAPPLIIEESPRVIQ